jgi:hypothetical protein
LGSGNPATGQPANPTDTMATQSNFELRRKLLQLEALYDVGRALNT